MRSLLLLFLLILPVPVLAFDACDSTALTSYKDIEQNLQKTLLYKVEKCGEKPSYVFGTFHADDPQLHPVVKTLTPVLSQVESAGFEVIATPEVQTQLLTFMMFPPQEPKGLSERVSKTTFSKLVAALKKKQLPAVLVNRMRPWAAMIMLGYPDHKADGVVVDERIQHLATSLKKSLYPLEKVEEQLSTFATMPEASQIVLLEESLATEKEGKIIQDKMTAAYKTHDLPKLAALGDTALGMMGDQKLRKTFEHGLITKRNHNMLKTMLQKMKTGSTLVAVGALHLPGKDGLLNLLEAEGYLITPVFDAK